MHALVKSAPVTPADVSDANLVPMGYIAATVSWEFLTHLVCCSVCGAV